MTSLIWVNEVFHSRVCDEGPSITYAPSTLLVYDNQGAIAKLNPMQIREVGSDAFLAAATFFLDVITHHITLRSTVKDKVNHFNVLYS